MKLNELYVVPGATKNRKRVGRGIGSGKGKTSGRGQKGQGSRAGVSLAGFEGGQMPLHRAMPKRGFTNIFRKEFNVLNFERLNNVIADKKIDASKEITPEILVAAGVISSSKLPLKVLAKGELASKVNISAHAFSKAAAEMITKKGGKATVIAN